MKMRFIASSTIVAIAFLSASKAAHADWTTPLLTPETIAPPVVAAPIVPPPPPPPSPPLPAPAHKNTCVSVCYDLPEGVYPEVHVAAPAAPAPVSPAPRAQTTSIPLQTRTVSEWYGGPMLGMDAGAAASTLVGGMLVIADLYNGGDGAGKAGGILLVSGLGMYAVGPAIVHAAHGEGGKAAASVGLRLGMPLAAILTERPELVLGAVLGAIIIDDVALARHDVVKAVAPQLAFAPLVDPKTKTGGLSATGTF